MAKVTAATPPTAALLLADDPSWAPYDARDELVPDRYWLAYIILYLMGVASLLPWNALITPVEYLKLRAEGSDFVHSLESILSIMFTSISFLTLLVLQRAQNYVTPRTRILSCLTLLLAIFGTLTGCAIAPLLVHDDELLDTLRDGATSQVLVIIVGAALCGIAQGVLTGSSMSYAALFARPHYLQAISGGQGVAGLTIATANLLFKLPSIARDCAEPTPEGGGMTPAHARDVVNAAVIYFGSVCFVLLLCVAGFLTIEWLPFTRARKRLNARAILASVTVNPLDAEALAGGVGGVTSSTSASPPTDPAPEEGFCVLLVRLWKWAFSVCFVYTVTIALFPSLTATIAPAPFKAPTNTSSSNIGGEGASLAGQLVTYQAQQQQQQQQLGLLAVSGAASKSGWCEWAGVFVPLGFVIFNLGDTIGRNLPCIFRAPNVILACVVVRLLFAPLFMLCHTNSHADWLPIFWGTDALPFLLMFIFSVTNGMFTSSIFVASQSIVEPKLRDAAASLLVMFLNLGIFLGAALNFVVLYLDCTPSEANGYSCNPFVQTGNASLALS